MALTLVGEKWFLAYVIHPEGVGSWKGVLQLRMTSQEAIRVGEVRRQGLHDRLSVKEATKQAPELSLGSSGQSQACLRSR